MKNVERCIMALVWRDVYWMDGSCDIHGTERNEVNSMDRLISEKAVLDILKNGKKYGERYYSMSQLIEIIKAIPSAEPKTGHWITEIKSDLRGDMWPTNPRCSECGGEPYYSHTIYNYKFCPYCGAKMVEPQESEVSDADSD